VLFAEPGHPYDDPDHPDQWAWRYGYFELLYTPGIKALSMSRGPKYSIHGGKRCCRRCHGNGYLTRHITPDRAADTPTPCPTCPAYRALFEDLPLWPLHFLDQLRRRIDARRRTTNHPPLTSDKAGPGWAGGYNDEPPF
jgi:hypothetical protein